MKYALTMKIYLGAIPLIGLPPSSSGFFHLSPIAKGLVSVISGWLGAPGGSKSHANTYLVIIDNSKKDMQLLVNKNDAINKQ